MRAKVSKVTAQCRIEYRKLSEEERRKASKHQSQSLFLSSFSPQPRHKLNYKFSVTFSNIHQHDVIQNPETNDYAIVIPTIPEITVSYQNPVVVIHNDNHDDVTTNLRSET